MKKKYDLILEFNFGFNFSTGFGGMPTPPPGFSPNQGQPRRKQLNLRRYITFDEGTYCKSFTLEDTAFDFSSAFGNMPGHPQGGQEQRRKLLKRN